LKTPVAVSDIRYDVTYDSATAFRRTIGVVMSFNAASAGDVTLSLPAWTPGSYEIVNFSRYVIDFSATDGAASIPWDKVDHDTWRIHVARAGQVRVSFDYLAMSLDNGAAWSRPEFAFFNGTNVFLYPEGASPDFSATCNGSHCFVVGNRYRNDADRRELIQRVELSRSRGHAVLHRQVRHGQRACRWKMDAVCELSRGECFRRQLAKQRSTSS
jgi:hypothetical protein